MDLTSVARYEAYMGLTSSAALDAVVAALIPRVSRAAEQFCGRSFSPETFSSLKLNGTGARLLRVPEWPIVSVASLYLLGNPVAVPVSADGLAYGYQYDDKYLYLTGACFPNGYRTVAVSYSSGFQGTETDFIPANPGPYTVTPSNDGYAGQDGGVVFTATGTALVPVGSNPATGQYAFSGGVYTYAAADAGREVTMTFYYVPGDVEQAVIETVGTSLAQRQQFGISSKHLRDESVTFEKIALPKSASDKLFSYRKVVAA